MIQSLADRLDELASSETSDLRLTHPALLEPVPQRIGAPVPIFRLALGAVLAVLAVGVWLATSDRSSEVDLAARPEGLATPSVLFESATALEDLPGGLADAFRGVQVIPPLLELDPDRGDVDFTGAQVVEFGDTLVAVGLDTSGSVLCLASTTSGTDVVASGCGTPASFAAASVVSSEVSDPNGTRGVVLVPDGVIEVAIGERRGEVVRNVAVLDGPIDNVIRLVRADGSSEPASSIPQPDAAGELRLAGGQVLPLLSTGCSFTQAGVIVEATFGGTDGLVSVVIEDDGVAVNGGIVGDVIETVAPGATVAIESSETTVLVSAQWNEGGGGDLRVECGNRLLDLASLR
jgi:hypothetical protein